ncbi:MAG: hypothetical protein ABJA67_04480, partial [Chthonomonadales bacterium]
YGFALIASETYKTGKLKGEIASQQRILNNYDGVIRNSVSELTLQQWATKFGYVRQSVPPMVIGKSPATN